MARRLRQVEDTTAAGEGEKTLKVFARNRRLSGIPGVTIDLQEDTLSTHPPLIDLPQVAVRLGVNKRYVRRLVAERRIPFIKLGWLLRFDPTDVERWLDEGRRN